MFNKVRRQKPIPKPEKPAKPSFAQFLKQKGRTRWTLGETDRFQRLRFAGFHERMQKIDVKLSHNPTKVAGMDYSPFEETDLMTSQTSTFIDALNSHNLLDVSLDYQAVSKTLAPFSTTFPMVVNNLGHIVDIIADKLASVDKDCKKALTEFVVALIKDTRELIFPMFLSKLMPALIRLVKVEEVDTLDNVFTAFSYAFKFLQRSIVEHLPEVYLCYYELLAHNNKYIRKFAAESFSFIIRTFKRKQAAKLIETLLRPLVSPQSYLDLPSATSGEEGAANRSFKTDYEALSTYPKDEHVDGFLEGLLRRQTIFEDTDKGKLALSVQTKENIIFSISQLAAEVMEGTQGAAHSKAFDFLPALLAAAFSHERIWVESGYICRYCITLLLDYLDPANDRVVYDSLERAFKGVFKACFQKVEAERKVLNEIEELQLNLVICVWKEWLAQAGGRKISQFSVVQILQNLNYLLCQNPQVFEKLSYLTQKSIIQCVALIYSLKQNVCIDIYQLNSPYPSKTTANLLRKQVFELRPARLLYDFIRLLTVEYESRLRTTQLIGDYNFSKTALTVVIPLEKQRALLSPLYDGYLNSTLGMLGSAVEQDYSELKLRVLYALRLADILGRDVQNVGKECVGRALQLLGSKNSLWKAWLEAEEPMLPDSEESTSLADLCLFLDLLARGRTALEFETKELLKVAKKMAGKAVLGTATNAAGCVNFCFPGGQVSKPYFYGVAFSRVVMMLLKTAESEKPQEIFKLTCEVLKFQRTNEYLLEAVEKLLAIVVSGKDPELLHALTHKISLKSEEENRSPATTLKDCVVISYGCLTENLSCNLRDVRLKSLRMLNSYFSDPDDCGMLRLLLKFEEPAVSLETERDKMIAAQDIKLLLNTRKVSPGCLKCCTILCFGTLWNKFSPLHRAAEEIFYSALEDYEASRQTLTECFLGLVKAVMSLSAAYASCDQVIYAGGALVLPPKDLYYDECRQKYVKTADYVELKPLANNMLKMLKRAVKLGRAEEVSGQVVEVLCDFVRTEYNKYFPELRAVFPQTEEVKPVEGEEELLEVMRKVNLYDSDEDVLKQLRKVAKDKMRCFMEVLGEVENFDTMQPEKLSLVNQIALQMLANSDEIVQKFAVDALASMGQDYVKHNLKLLQSLAAKEVGKDVLPNIDLVSTPAGERTSLLSAILLLFYGRLTKKKGKRGKSHKRDMTSQIFNFISRLEKDDVLLAVHTFLSKYQLAASSPSTLGLHIAKLPFNKMRGLCYTIKLIIKHLGRLVDDVIPYLGGIVLQILKLSLAYYAKDKSNFFRKIAHTIYVESIKRLKDFYTQYNETEFLAPITEEFVALFKDKITNMHAELSQGKSNLLGIFMVWSSNPLRLQENFVKFPFVFDAVFQLLTAPKLTGEVAGCVLQMLANLLGSEPRPCASLFQTRIVSVVDCIYTYISRLDEEQKGLSQNSAVFASLSELAGYLSESQEDSITKLISLLTPHMFKAARAKRGGEVFIHLVRTLKTLFAKQSAGKGKLQFFVQFTPLLLRTRGFLMRHELTELLATLSAENKELEKYAVAVQLMNRYSRNGTEIEPDFDVVIKEMNTFNAALKDAANVTGMPLAQIRIVLYHYMSCLSHDDFSVRSAAEYGMKLFFETLYKQAMETSSSSEGEIREEYMSFIIKDFIPLVERLLRSKEEAVMRTVVLVLRTYLLSSQSVPVLAENPGLHCDLTVLLHAQDTDQDFFCNITHPQLHRRFKALRAATAAAKEKKLRPETEIKILLPLATSFIFQSAGEDAEQDKKATVLKKSGYARQVIVDATELIGSIVPHLSPEQYFVVVKRFCGKLVRRSNKEAAMNVLVNTICKILENFPFDSPDAVSVLEREVEKRLSETKDRERDTRQQKKDIVANIVRGLGRANMPSSTDLEVKELLIRLRKTVFPALKNTLSNTKGASREEAGERHKDIRPNVALALIRVARKFDLRQFLDEYEKIVTLIVAPLRSKDLQLRDKVRSVLYDVIGLSSPFVLQIVLDQMLTGLTKDYQRHVLLYTVHGIFHRISKSHREAYAGRVGHCVSGILPLIMKGVTGALAEEAETEEVIRRCREAKDPKAVDLYVLLAQLINVKEPGELEGLIQPLIDELQATNEVKHIHKCESALGRIVDGILKNPALTSEVLVGLTRSVIDQGFALIEKKDDSQADEKSHRVTTTLEQKEHTFLVQEGAASGARVVLSTAKKEVKNEQLSGRTICVFGFSLLYAGMAKQLMRLPNAIVAVHKPNPDTVEFGQKMEDSKKPEEPVPEPMVLSETSFEWAEKLVPDLIKALKSPYTQLVQVALKIYDKLLDRQVKALQDRAPELLSYLIKQFDFMNLSDQEMVQCVFRCVTHILESHSGAVSLGPEQIRALLDLVKLNMREAEKQVQVFRCVRAVVGLGQKSKKIDEIVDYVTELMITSYSKNVRENCGGIFMDYVVKCIDVSSQKFTDKVQFLLKNLSYEDEDARLYLLHLLAKLLDYILKSAELKWADTFFVTLVLRLANEDSAKCKKKLVALIETLLTSATRDVQKQLVGSLFIWFKDPNSKSALRMVCFQLAGVVAKVWKDSFVPYLDYTLSQIALVAFQSAGKISEENKSRTEAEEPIHTELTELMRSIKLLDPNTSNAEEVKSSAEERQRWMLCYMAMVCLEKLFENVRGHLLNAIRKTEESSMMWSVVQLLEHKHYWIRGIACRIIGHYFSDREGQDVKQEVVYFREGKEKEIGLLILGLFRSKFLDEQLATQAIKNILFIVKTFGGPVSSSPDVIHTLLSKATNLGKTLISAPEAERTKMPFLIRLIGGIVLCVSEDKLQTELQLALALVYRIATNPNYKGTEASKLSTEIMDAVAGKVGNEKYTEGLNALKVSVQNSRTERKMKAKSIKLTNPQAAIKQKMKLKEKGKEKRRKKNEGWAIKRKGAIDPSGSVVTKRGKHD